jgi:hypothetical protein
VNVYEATRRLNHDPRNPRPTCDCLNCKPDREVLMKQLVDTQHELALLMDRYKLYRGAWCCDQVAATNGWHHVPTCKNWVLKL